MFVPKTISVGYQKRNDTYTGKLAYIIYTDDKGVLRKESSWNGWRDKGIKPDQFDNVPTSGFVLNKGVGGVRQSYGWNARNEYVRVYDPRNFEFEISIANLLFILQECSSIKGKGLEGEFVYSWSGTQLVLLPVDSEEYKECVKHTERQSKKVDKEDIIDGCTYVMKDGTNVIYLGSHNYNDTCYSKNFNPKGKRHIFASLNKREVYDYDKGKNIIKTIYFAEKGYTNIAERTSQEAASSYTDMLDEFLSSKYVADIKSFQFVPVNKSEISTKLTDTLLFKKDNDNFYPIIAYRNFNYNNNILSVKTSSKKYIPNLSNIKIPSLSGVKEDQYTSREFSKLDLYKLQLVTPYGKKYEI